nr:oleate hydratase [Bradyrhizobium sp. AC87j1]
MMPYVTSLFIPRQVGDRPDVVPKDAVNFAFIGQFAESGERDCIFTTEYLVRMAMAPSISSSRLSAACSRYSTRPYDIRKLLAAMGRLHDGKEIEIPGPALLPQHILKKISSTELGELINKYYLS